MISRPETPRRMTSHTLAKGVDFTSQPRLPKRCRIPYRTDNWKDNGTATGHVCTREWNVDDEGPDNRLSRVDGASRPEVRVWAYPIWVRQGPSVADTRHCGGVGSPWPSPNGTSHTWEEKEWNVSRLVGKSPLLPLFPLSPRRTSVFLVLYNKKSPLQSHLSKRVSDFLLSRETSVGYQYRNTPESYTVPDTGRET